MIRSALACRCGRERPSSVLGLEPYACDRRGEGDVDHVVVRHLLSASVTEPIVVDEANPFLRFRRMLHSYHLAREHGMGDADYVELVTRLDEAIAKLEGTGFRVTPVEQHDELDSRVGMAEVFIKDETGSVGGSHKARHLMGLLLHLKVREALGLSPPGERRSLAIASCGNAALAAAVLARADERDLSVFIPTDANPAVVSRLSDLGARVVVCERQEGVLGDPCYHAFRESVRDGALPFCCQGPDNGLCIEGAITLGFELIEAVDHVGIDRVFIQVGGGALASAILQAYRDAGHLGIAQRVPRFHPVQTSSAFPLARAYDRLADQIAKRIGVRTTNPALRADCILTEADDVSIRQEVGYAVHHRSEFMSPWETAPHSIAHGILDDETYDWVAVLEGTLRSGGYPIVVPEETLSLANRMARELTQIPVDPTGSAGLAGLIACPDRKTNERAIVVFSGVDRDGQSTD